MNGSVPLTRTITWVARLRRILHALDEAVGTDRIEYLERRLSAVEQNAFAHSDPLAEKKNRRRNVSAD
jgi:hypothetical protein